MTSGAPKPVPRDTLASGRSQQSGASEHGGSATPSWYQGKQVARKPFEMRIREAIKDECELQRVALLRTVAAEAQMTLLVNILRELLSRTDFVAVLTAAGFAKIPRLVHQCLRVQSAGSRTVPSKLDTRSDISSCQRDRQADVLEEIAALLTGKELSARTIQALSRMTPLRRLAVANVMSTADNFTGDFAHAFLAATPDCQRTAVARAHASGDSRTRSFARIEKRLIGLQAKNQVLSADHNDNLLHLAVCSSYVRSWIHSYDVLAWLRMRYPHHAVSLERVVKEADGAKEPKRPMKLPYSCDRTAGPARKPV
ncbi:plasmid partitioning protein RepB C-terminal domain-containing protein [Paraburkholderia sediminicola]|uniref:plasmid partitioning protein RepB C-terminal domain-containing protein n=1 Tax=Paraburkholderia sediminicola TaxID=458836 RepID=UPI0038B82F46